MFCLSFLSRLEVQTFCIFVYRHRINFGFNRKRKSNKKDQINVLKGQLTGISCFHRRRAASGRGDARLVSEWQSPAPPAERNKPI